MVSAAEKELGGFVRAHPTDNARRGTVGLVSLGVGVATGAVSVPLLMAVFEDTEGTRRGLLPGLVLGLALVCLWAGISNGLRYLLRHGEVIKVREGGLVYERTGEVRVIPWERIERVSDRGQDNGFSRMFGWDVYCGIKLKDGGRLIITGFTRDARQLVHTVRLAFQDEVRPEPPPRP